MNKFPRKSNLAQIFKLHGHPVYAIKINGILNQSAPIVILSSGSHCIEFTTEISVNYQFSVHQLIRNFDPILIMLFSTQKPIHRKPPVDRHLAPEPEFTAAPDSPPRPSTSADHTYCADPSPSKMKRKLGTATETIENLRKKLKVTQQKTRRLKKKVEKLSSVVEELKNKGMVSENCVEILNSTFSGVPLAVMSRILKNQASGKKSRQEYDTVIKSFALTLNFYSAKAYDYVREVFDLALPSPSTIRTWYSAIDGSPGFNQVVFDALEARFKEDRSTLCALMLDEMSLMESVEMSGDKVLGYVDIGAGNQDDTAPLAKNALVIMLVAVNDHWKVPVAHFFINGLTGKEQANLVSQCLLKLHEIGVNVISLTCDGPSAHLTMLKELGASINPDNMNSSFPHPADPHKLVWAFLDACHMLKLARNCLGTLKTMRDSSQRVISWKYIENLYELQKQEGLRLANKLSRKHIEWKTNIMKVNTAAQTLSSSVADAIEFCREELKLPEFQGSEGTCIFIHTLDQLFDLLNSRNPLARNYKAPMHPAREAAFLPFLEKTSNYLTTLTNTSGQLMTKTRLKTAFIGMLTCIVSVKNLYLTYVQPQNSSLKYLLTYKLSQDHIELFFGAVRLACGGNNNPTARQFIAAYKRLLMRHDIKANKGNCSAQDATRILTAASFKNITKRAVPDKTQDMLIARRYDLQLRQPMTSHHDYADIPPFNKLSVFLESVVTYIAGYVVRMVKRTLKCQDCLLALTQNDNVNLPAYRLIAVKTRGGLTVPSSSVVQVCEATEKCVKRMLAVTNGKIPRDSYLKSAISASVLAEVGSSAFDSLSDHMFETEADCNHVFSLIQHICECYTKIRLHHVVRTMNTGLKDKPIRKKFSKLILFAHQ